MFAWHVHHTRLYEVLNSGGITERQGYIKYHKPAKERPRRLRLLRIVKNQELLSALVVAKEAGPSAGIRRRLNNIINALHSEECKRCTWNGKTIFPKGVK